MMPPMARGGAYFATHTMKHRIFIAIDIPRPIKGELRRLLAQDVEKYAELYAGANLMDEESWHVTLAFLGEKSEEQIETIGRMLRAIAGQTPAPTIAIRTLTTAPPHRPPRMVWAATTTGTNRLLEPIRNTIVKKLAAHAIQQDGETFPLFNGHVTLARLPEGRRIADHTVSFPDALTFRPKTIGLMESHLEDSGAKYKTLKSIDFKPSV